MHPWGEVNGAPGHNAAHQVLRDLNQPRLRLNYTGGVVSL